MPPPAILEETPGFSLTLGGPVYRFLRRVRLAGPTLELQKRRVLLVITVTWLPLLFLSALTGHLLGGQGLPFLRDIETHVRFLIALPALVIAELVVHQRIPPALKLFVERGVVTAEDNLKFHAAIRAAMRLRNSVPLELALVVFAYTPVHWIGAPKLPPGPATPPTVPPANHLPLPL